MTRSFWSRHDDKIIRLLETSAVFFAEQILHAPRAKLPLARDGRRSHGPLRYGVRLGSRSSVPPVAWLRLNLAVHGDKSV